MVSKGILSAIVSLWDLQQEEVLWLCKILIMLLNGKTTSVPF